MADNRLKAMFEEQEPRFVSIGKKRFPVLLMIFREGDNYGEDISDPDDFPPDFVREFSGCLQTQGQAIPVKTGPHGGSPWEAQTLYEIETFSVSNFLQCRLGARVGWVTGRWDPYEAVRATTTRARLATKV